jgi:hypothetical protein
LYLASVTVLFILTEINPPPPINTAETLMQDHHITD